MTTTPELGKVAVEVRPIPPRVVGKIPVTAALCDKFMAPNEGVPPSLGITKVWNAAPAPVDSKLPLSLPSMTPLLVKLVAPVPPLLTPKTPDVILAVDKLGISATTKLVPAVTRPLASTVTLM